MSYGTTDDVDEVGAPRKLAYSALRFTGTDWMVIAVCFTVMIWLSSTVTPLLGIAFVLPLSIYLLWPLNNARRYYAWLMAAYGVVWVDWVCEGVLFSATPRPDRTWWRRTLMRIFIEPNVFMARVDGLYDIGLRYGGRTNTDTIAIEVDGWSLEGKALSTQGALQNELSESILSLAYLRGLKPRVSFVTRSRYEDGSDQLVQQQIHSLPGVFPTDESPNRALEEMKRRSMEVSDESAMKLYHEGILSRDDVADFRVFEIQHTDVIETIRQYNRKHEMLVLLTIPQSARFKNARRRNEKKRKPIERSEVERQDVVRIARRFRRDLLVLGMDNPQILNKQELEDSGREGWDVDPSSITEYREWRLDHPDEDRSQPEKSVTTDGKMVCFDGTSYHAVLRLTGLPEKVYPDTNRQLFEYLPVEIESYVTRSVVSEVVRGTGEYIRTTAFYNLMTSIFTTFGAERFGAKAEMHEERIRAKGEKLAREDNVNWFSVYIGLASTDPAVIERDIDLIDEAVQKMRGNCELITGSAWVPRAVNSVNYAIADM